MQRLRKISLGLLIAAALLILTSAWLLTPTPAHAATTYQSGGGKPVWCGNWYPNPDTLINKQTAPYTHFVNNDGHSFAIFEGQDPVSGQWYYYAYEANGAVGDQIALDWVYNGDTYNYQCGDGNARSTATVWSGRTDTWTAGVPANRVLTTSSSSSLPYAPYVDIFFWPSGHGTSAPIVIGVY